VVVIKFGLYSCRFSSLQVSLLSPLGRNYYMNITPNNVVHLYPRYETTGSLQSTIKLRELVSEDLEFAIPSPPSVTPAVPLCSIPLRSNQLRPQISKPDLASRPIASNYHRTPVRTILSPSSAVDPRSNITLLPLSSTIARPSSGVDNRMSLRTANDASNRSLTNSFACTPVSINSRQYPVGEHRTLGEKPVFAASSPSPIVSRSGSVLAQSSPGTPKFTFKRSVTSPPSVTVGQNTHSYGSSLIRPTSSNSVDPLGDRSNKVDDRSNSRLVAAKDTTAKSNESVSNDIWKAAGKLLTLSVF